MADDDSPGGGAADDAPGGGGAADVGSHRPGVSRSVRRRMVVRRVGGPGQSAPPAGAPTGDAATATLPVAGEAASPVAGEAASLVAGEAASLVAGEAASPVVGEMVPPGTAGPATLRTAAPSGDAATVPEPAGASGAQRAEQPDEKPESTADAGLTGAGGSDTAGSPVATPAGHDRPADRRHVAAHPPDPGPRAWRVASVVLVLLLVAGLVGLALTGRTWWDQRQLDAAHQQALAAARQATLNFMSINAKTVDRDLSRIVDGAAGDFKDEFTRDRAQVKSAVTTNKVDSQASVLRVALVTGDRRNAVVLVAVDATIHNAAAPDGRLLHYRIRVDLTHDGRIDRWLVNKLQFVG